MRQTRTRLVSVLGPIVLLAVALASAPQAGAQERRTDAAPLDAAPAAAPERTPLTRGPAVPAVVPPASAPPTTPPPTTPPTTTTRTTPPTAGAGTSTAAPPASDTVVPDCRTTPVPGSPAQGNLKLTIDVKTKWQPVGGMVKFTIEGNDLTVDGLKIVACFGGLEDKKLWRSSHPVQVLQTELHKVTFGAVVPDVGFPWWDPIPTSADFRIMANSPAAWKQIDTVVPIRVTPRLAGVLVPLVVIVAAWITLCRVAGKRDVRGGPFLRIIANRNSYASLSQLQIILWTLVIGAGAMYVMVLSGDLIDIPAQALMLLGISGLAILGNQLPGATASLSGVSQAPASAPAAQPPAPGAVTSLSVVGPVDSTRAVLFWEPPSAGSRPAFYLIQQTSPAPAAGTPAPTTVDLFFSLVGLAPGTAHSFTVQAVDALGKAGPASQPIPVLTPAAALGPAPAQPTNLTSVHPEGDTAVAVGATSLTLTWTAPAAPPASARYLVRYRRSGAAAWTTALALVDGPGYTIGGLVPATTYEFQVAAVGNGAIGPWSAPAVVITLKRVPRWADLVILDGINEIDVTRVQMLLFTVIAAGFVLVKIAGNSAIPDIPAGIVTLMGLSNGVYLAAKFIPPQK